MQKEKITNREMISWLILTLPILVLIGLSIQFMALDVDGVAVVKDDRSYFEYMADWWIVHGVNRFLGQGTFVALYQLPGILSLYTLAPLVALTSRLLVVIVAIRMMGGKVKDFAWLLGLIVVTPFWMDPALLFARAVNELISALIFYFVFRKHADQIGVLRILAFVVLQVIFYEALLIPVLALIWFVKREERRALYVAVTLFGVLYVAATKLGILSSSKFVTSVQSDGVVVKSDGVSTFMPYAGKLTQLVNSVQAITPTILLISLIIAGFMAYLITKLWSQMEFDDSNRDDVIEVSPRRWIELFLAITAPVLVNWVVSIIVGNHGRVYWMMLSYSWLLFILLSYFLRLHVRYKKASVTLISFIFFLSTILVLELHTDLSNQDIDGFSGKFFRGFTSHFGFH
jgi:hypothetical protein